MCKALEDMRNSTREEVQIENAERRLLDGLDMFKVAEYSGLSMEKVEEIANELLATAQ